MIKISLPSWLNHRFAWWMLIFDLGLIFIIPDDIDFFGSLALMLIYGSLLIISVLVATTWLMIAYRQIFRFWVGWTIPIILLAISSHVVTDAWPIDQPKLSLFFTILTVVSIWMIGLATALLLWYRDAGLGLIGWTLVIYVWTSALTWRFQGNFLELFLFSMNNPDFPDPLWWFRPLFCLTGWVVPLGLFGFIMHTIRVLSKELYTDDVITTPVLEYKAVISIFSAEGRKKVIKDSGSQFHVKQQQHLFQLRCHFKNLLKCPVPPLQLTNQFFITAIDTSSFMGDIFFERPIAKISPRIPLIFSGWQTFDMEKADVLSTALRSFDPMQSIALLILFDEQRIYSPLQYVAR